MGDPEAAPVDVGVVRQEQIYAFAVVVSDGTERSLLLSRAFMDRRPRILTGDLVAVRNDLIVYQWSRAVALGESAAGVRLRLNTRQVIVAPRNPRTLDPAIPLPVGEPVFTDGTEVLCRAWPWYEPALVSPAVLTRAAEVVQAQPGP
jgi:hypothetical protein